MKLRPDELKHLKRFTGIDLTGDPGIKENWRDQAVCSQVDPELFFPVKSDANQVRVAKGICATCPVLSECRDWAMTELPEYGVIGGLSVMDRRRLRKATA